MPHSLIVGQTESGKTTLAIHLAQEYQKRGIKVAVLDPMLDRRWSADFITDDPQAFTAVARSSRRCALFVDESGAVIGRYNDEFFWLATQARHLGHNSHFITQRAAQLNPTVRDQCGHLFAFRLSFRDAKVLSDEYGMRELSTAYELQKFHFYWIPRFGVAKLMRMEPHGPVQIGVIKEGANESPNTGIVSGRGVRAIDRDQINEKGGNRP